jgi:hypothetical protein
MITVKNVQIQEKLSEETLCFSATIYFKGRRVGEATNRGCGGCNNYHWFDRAASKVAPAEIEAWAEDQDLEFDFEKLDQIIGKLVHDFDDARRMRRLSKNKTVFRLAGDDDGTYRSLSIPYSDRAQKYLDTEFGDKVIEIVGVTHA